MMRVSVTQFLSMELMKSPRVLAGAGVEKESTGCTRSPPEAMADQNKQVINTVSTGVFSLFL